MAWIARPRFAWRAQHLAATLLLAAALAGCTGPFPPQPTPTPSPTPPLHVSITEFTLPSATTGALSITAGPDGAMWFTEVNSYRSTYMVGRITPQGSVTEFPVASVPDAQPGDITTGPDGALWFTEQRGAIGRMTISGAVIQFALPNADTWAEAIAAGPDGALWFTEPRYSRIGRITTSGQISEFPISAPCRSPADITAGPDGALRFTEDASRIGRIMVTR